MDIAPQSSLLDNIRIQDLSSYLALTGWHQIGSNQRWSIFMGGSDIEGNPLEIVVPNSTSMSNAKVYLANSINLLSALADESPEVTIRRVKYVDNDVLTMWNRQTGEYESITLNLASVQVTQLKNLVAYAACSEKNPRPHFNTILKTGYRMVDHYRFGHTLAGSFGFTVQSMVVNPEDVFTREVQGTLFDLEPFIDSVVYAPIERRVMERIVRGLGLTHSASVSNNPQILIDAYPIALNSNMCTALAEAANDKEATMEYNILWSPRYPASEDVANLRSVRFNENTYPLLIEVAEELKRIEPEIVRIRGLVTELSSASDPLGEGDFERSVAIRWINRPDNAKAVKVIVALNREQYIQAHKAHLGWNTVEVTGSIVKTGNTWRLADAQDFEIVH